MTPRRSSNVLSNRALNRALLERQLLLRRSRRGALETIEHLIGLQAQVPNSPYLALWSRLHNFRLDDLTALITARRVVRLALMTGPFPTRHQPTAPWVESREEHPSNTRTCPA